MRRLCLALILLSSVILLTTAISSPKPVFGGGDDAAEEPTQILVMGEAWGTLAQMNDILNREKEILENLDKRVKQAAEEALIEYREASVTDGEYLKDAAKTMNNVYDDYNRLLARLSAVDQAFYRRFFSKKNSQSSQESWIKNYSKEYYEQSLAIDNKYRETLDFLKVTAQDMYKKDVKDKDKYQSSVDLLETLIKKQPTMLNPTVGKDKILQIGNSLMMFVGGELLKTRALMLEQKDSYADFFRWKQANEYAFSTVMSEDLTQWVKKNNGYINTKSYTGDLHSDRGWRSW